MAGDEQSSFRIRAEIIREKGYRDEREGCERRGSSSIAGCFLRPVDVEEANGCCAAAGDCDGGFIEESDSIREGHASQCCDLGRIVAVAAAVEMNVSDGAAGDARVSFESSESAVVANGHVVVVGDEEFILTNCHQSIRCREVLSIAEGAFEFGGFGKYVYFVPFESSARGIVIDDEESLALFMIFYSQGVKGICALVHGVQLQFERTTLRCFSVRPHVNSRIGVSRRVLQNSLQAHTPQHKSKTPPIKHDLRDRAFFFFLGIHHHHSPTQYSTYPSPDHNSTESIPRLHSNEYLRNCE